MSALYLLRTLTGAGLRVTVDGDRLAIQPASKLTDELRAAVRSAKPELLKMILRFEARRARLLRWGWPAEDAERVAARLSLLDDAHDDDRVVCVSCAAFRPWRCSNHLAAGLMGSDVGRELAALPQRCAGFTPAKE